MVSVFHGSISGKPDGQMTHLGPCLDVAVEHLASVFMAAGSGLYDRKTGLFDPSRAKGKTFSDLFASYADTMEKAEVFNFELRIKKPLTLTDYWNDDPIGSGGPEILRMAHELTLDQRKEAAALFKPFEGIIYPDAPEFWMMAKSVAKLEKEILSDSLFANELEKRRKKLGPKRFKADFRAEVMWTYYTMKITRWAQKRGYDGFSYYSKREISSLDPFFVSFYPKQIQVSQKYKFDGPAFREQIEALEGRLMTRRRLDPDYNIVSLLSDKKFVQKFWKAEPA